MATAKALLTAEDLFAMDTDQRYELVKEDARRARSADAEAGKAVSPDAGA